jgi:hypothetical protein
MEYIIGLPLTLAGRIKSRAARGLLFFVALVWMPCAYAVCAIPGIALIVTTLFFDTVYNSEEREP